MPYNYNNPYLRGNPLMPEEDEEMKKAAMRRSIGAAGAAMLAGNDGSNNAAQLMGQSAMAFQNSYDQMLNQALQEKKAANKDKRDQTRVETQQNALKLQQQNAKDTRAFNLKLQESREKQAENTARWRASQGGREQQKIAMAAAEQKRIYDSGLGGADALMGAAHGNVPGDAMMPAGERTTTPQQKTAASMMMSGNPSIIAQGNRLGFPDAFRRKDALSMLSGGFPGGPGDVGPDGKPAAPPPPEIPATAEDALRAARGQEVTDAETRDALKDKRQGLGGIFAMRQAMALTSFSTREEAAEGLKKLKTYYNQAAKEVKKNPGFISERILESGSKMMFDIEKKWGL